MNLLGNFLEHQLREKDCGIWHCMIIGKISMIQYDVLLGFKLCFKFQKNNID